MWEKARIRKIMKIPEAIYDLENLLGNYLDYEIVNLYEIETKDKIYEIIIPQDLGDLREGEEVELSIKRRYLIFREATIRKGEIEKRGEVLGVYSKRG